MRNRMALLAKVGTVMVGGAQEIGSDSNTMQVVFGYSSLRSFVRWCFHCPMKYVETEGSQDI